MPIEYYIGMAVGIFSVLVACAVSKLTQRRESMCDKCENLRSKDWNGKYWCREEGIHYLAPKYCSLYKEREDEHGNA